MLASARELFVTKGYVATTIADIARHARVAVDTVYATVGRKPALLREVLESALSGTDAVVPAEQRDYVKRSQQAARATDKITAYAQALFVRSDTRRYFTDSPAVAGWGMIAQHGNGVYAPSLNTAPVMR